MPPMWGERGRHAAERRVGLVPTMVAIIGVGIAVSAYALPLRSEQGPPSAAQDAPVGALVPADRSADEAGGRADSAPISSAPTSSAPTSSAPTSTPSSESLSTEPAARFGKPLLPTPTTPPPVLKMSLGPTPTPPQAEPGQILVAPGSEHWDVGQVYNGPFPDPDIVSYDGRWYAYSTNTAMLHLPTLVSDDLVTWTPITDEAGNRYDPMPVVGDWVQGGISGPSGLWAPSVAKMGEGWTAAYVGQQSIIDGHRHNCIGLARATAPWGPFVPLGPAVECPTDMKYGPIDPDLFVDADGRNWMLWKDPGAVGLRPNSIFARQLNPDGTGWADGSTPHEILRLAGGWEGPIVENPSMIQFRGVYYLFYSGNFYNTDKYATGYAICDTPAGPCTRPSSEPLLHTGNSHISPGGASAFEDDGSLRLIYHAWVPGRINDLRTIHIAGLWKNDDDTLSVIDVG